MATQTQHLFLTKPDAHENYDVSVFNDNADIIDSAFFQLSKSVCLTTSNNLQPVHGTHYIYEDGTLPYTLHTPNTYIPYFRSKLTYVRNSDDIGLIFNDFEQIGDDPIGAASIDIYMFADEGKYYAFIKRDSRDIDTSEIADGAVTKNKLGTDVVKRVTNLLNPESFNKSSNTYSVTISNLQAGKAYYTNIHMNAILSVMSYADGSMDTIPMSYNSDGYMYISANDMIADNLTIILFPGTNIDRLMLCEGSLPEQFIKYGEDTVISESLLSSTPKYEDIYKPTVIAVTAEPATPIYLDSVNSVYELNISSGVGFRFRTTGVTTGQQILIHAVVTDDAPIDWGTTYFFNSEVPTITPGEYDFIFEFGSDHWYAGAVSKGAVS